jgi:eukaryotic-like serine/threonine-protein kinase
VNPPTASDRSRPRIHDHETLKLIGRGAYGEVWLARSVTGVWRAVKVVWRSDYDYVEAFEREFEAIKRYEPVSRKHPGLVPVLQVGRNDEEGFYYYVMELADDVEGGREINPVTYRPLTLTARMHKEKRLKASECLKFGQHVAEGLHFMHQNGLIHRDVKPSNLVFMDGVCRLADIGLVALLGQRSFVGTEGFVAPEGPGTAESDVFSLGMVLYEASTGKDRLDFPDLPMADESGEGLEQWRLLHRVVCRACAQHAKDRYSSSQEMALALRGERVPDRNSRRWQMAVLASLAVVSIAGMVWLNQREQITAALHRSEPLLTLKSEPPGAEIYSNGLRLGVTPFSLNPAENVPSIYQFRLAGYRIQEVEHTASQRQPATYEIKLEKSQLPQPGERWVNNQKMSFLPRQIGHTSEHPVEMRFFDVFLKATNRPFEGRVVPYVSRGEKTPIYIVVVPQNDAEAFSYWLADADRSTGYLTNEHHYEIEAMPYVEGANPPRPQENMPPPESANDESRDWQAFYLRVERQGYGSVIVRSNPPGVSVFQRDELLGITPLEIPRVKTGEVEFDLRSEAFTDLILEGDVAENELLELYADMEARRGVSFGREWKNSMGVRFLPLGDILMASIETRRRDYAEYAKATNSRRPMQTPDQQKGGGVFPVVGVDREEARSFCAWLTKRERELNLIGKADRYRLPTDEEWSRAVGLPLERGKDPKERNGRIRGVYPWGYEWPPPRGVDNFADEAFAQKSGQPAHIQRYQDRFPFLAAVTALPTSSKGFVGISGNVSEWVETDYESAEKMEPGQPTTGTLRGGNWRTSVSDELLSSARMPMPVNTKRDGIGFRIVLARE